MQEALPVLSRAAANSMILCATAYSTVAPLYKGHSEIGHLSNEDTVCCPNHRVVYKSKSEVGTPLYTLQPAGSQWCPL